MYLVRAMEVFSAWFLFWFLAGTWNWLASTLWWKSISSHDKVLNKNIGARASIFICGIFYALVPFDEEKFWWCIWVGIIGKLGVVVQYIFDTVILKKKGNPVLTAVVTGDFLWAIAFYLLK